MESFVYTLYIDKKVYHSFLFVNTDVSQATFPVSFVHWSTRFSNCVAFFLLFWFHVKSHENHEVTYATLLSLRRAVSELRRPCGKWLKSLEKRMRCFQKKILPALRETPFQFFFKFRQSGTKIVRLITKERLSRPPSLIINVELEFEESGKALHYLSTLIWGERGENWVVSRICAPDCRYYFCLLYLAFV